MPTNAITNTGPLLGPTHRVLSWIRAALVAHAGVLNLQLLAQVDHPGVLIGITALMIVWSVVMALWNSVFDPWRQELALADIVVACALVASSRWVLGPMDANPGDYLPVTGYWHAAAAMSAAMNWGSVWGLVTAGVLWVASVWTAAHRTDPHVWSSGFATCLAAWGVGQMVNEIRDTLAQRDRSTAESMALAERDRMNRIVHDGALQVLSLVEREGRSMGPRGQRLAQLARQQEIALRTLLQDRTVEIAGDENTSDVDITLMLDAMSSDRVTVSMMAGAVMMPVGVAHEIKGAVAQALLNTELHAGADAHSWILLEEEGDGIILSVRDNGVGMTSEQVQQAFDAGRLGIRESIIGRLRDLGGTAQVTSDPGKGVEWELRIPRVMCPEPEEEKRQNGGLTHAHWVNGPWGKERPRG